MEIGIAKKVSGSGRTGVWTGISSRIPILHYTGVVESTTSLIRKTECDVVVTRKS
jgi:hypothetical protein